MSLMSSLYTGQSGLSANSVDLTVIGDNIANANTIGFKGSRAAFEAALSQSVINGGQLGMGVNVQAIQRMMQQGSLANTGIATDLAIDGNGMFVVKGNHAGQQGTWYTRAGQFTVDADGFLVNLEGLKVQGYPADALGTVSSIAGDLQVGEASSAPKPTGTVDIQANLSADDSVPILTWDATDPTNTSNFATPTEIYDSLGIKHDATIYYCKTASGAWDWHVMADGAEVGTGSLTFDTNGNLTNPTASFSFSPAGATAPQTVNLDFTGTTQFGGENANRFTSQDGWASGELSSVAINAKGEIIGAFSNGQTRTLGNVALADFPAPDKLRSIGGNLFGMTPDSGDALVGRPREASRGSLVSGALEQSNVDLAGEFVKMISAQRGFQANSKTISTADSLLAELMALKR
ncbi:MAG: flagellar hook protein FlgE [Myxococcales bacterium]